jgi:hypothetical protein
LETVAFLTTYPSSFPRYTLGSGSAQSSGAGWDSSHRSAGPAGLSAEEATSAQNTRAGCGGHSARVGLSLAAS